MECADLSRSIGKIMKRISIEGKRDVWHSDYKGIVNNFFFAWVSSLTFQVFSLWCDHMYQIMISHEHMLTYQCSLKRILFTHLQSHSLNARLIMHRFILEQVTVTGRRPFSRFGWLGRQPEDDPCASFLRSSSFPHALDHPRMLSHLAHECHITSVRLVAQI